MCAAVEIHGHDKVIIVGLKGKIYCSTYLNATRMEWFLVGVEDSKPVEADLDEQQLILTIDAKNAALNGDMFTCRVTDVEGNQYEETVTTRVKSKLYQNIVVFCQNFTQYQLLGKHFAIWLSLTLEILPTYFDRLCS